MRNNEIAAQAQAFWVKSETRVELNDEYRVAHEAMLAAGILLDLNTDGQEYVTRELGVAAYQSGAVREGLEQLQSVIWGALEIAEGLDESEDEGEIEESAEMAA